MVKKANTQKPSKNKKDEQYIGVKKAELDKLHELLNKQTETIIQLRQERDQAREACVNAEDSLAEANDLAEHRRVTLDRMMELSETKHDLFNELYDMAEQSVQDCQKLEKQARAYQVGFYGAIAMNVTFAVIHFFFC